MISVFLRVANYSLIVYNRFDYVVTAVNTVFLLCVSIRVHTKNAPCTITLTFGYSFSNIVFEVN